MLGCDATIVWWVSTDRGGFMGSGHAVLVVPKPQGEAQTIFTFTVFSGTSCTCNHLYLLNCLTLDSTIIRNVGKY